MSNRSPNIFVKLVRRTLISIVVMALLLFLPAGTVDWPSAWVFLGSQLILSLVGGYWLAESDPELLEERLKPLFQQGQTTADKVILVLLMTLGTALFVVMGLDRRFGWSHVPLLVQILGALLLLPMGALSYLTFRENRFAAAVVRVQKERGHHVIANGPYAYVRHPMYLGAIFFCLGTPLMLGALSGLVVGALLIALFGMRAVLEERTLAAGLPGYADYARRVRYRLLPWVW
jgi:protein-S-isoprenylcysteine O-methyltransferase Ste14